MKNHNDRDDELRKLSSELADTKRDNPYTVPHRYFAELPDQVMARIHEESAQKTDIPIWRKLATALGIDRRPALALAFASVVIVVVAAFFLLPDGSSGREFALEPFSSDEALAYALEHIDEFSTEELYSATADAGITIPAIEEASDDELDAVLDDLIDDIDTDALEAIF